MSLEQSQSLAFFWLTNPCREIIDESDVYIDVHKAIRRLTPAPKARPIKKDVDEAVGTPIINGKLVDVDYDEEDDDEHEPHPRNKRVNSVGAQDGVILSTSPGKTATFLMRRSSAGPDGRMTATTVPVKANLEEFKRQLKHLGPSNRNTNPRDTRSTTVKIKSVNSYQQALPVMASPTGLRPASIAGEPVESLGIQLDGDDDADETTPLVPSMPAPTVSGKGGVTAVRRSYGGAGMSEAQIRLAGTQGSPVNTGEFTTEAHSGPQLQMPTISDEQTRGSNSSNNASPTSPQPGDTVIIDPGRTSSQGSVISVIDDGSSTPRRRHIVRSGSISENVVETSSGVRKIIIQAASSDSEDASMETAIRARASPSISSQSATGQSALNVTEDDVEEEATGASNTANGGGSSSTGKKKNKKKKKKGKA